MRCVERRLRCVARRPLAVLPVRIAAVAIKIDAPLVPWLRWRVGHEFGEILQRDRHFDDPVAIAIGIVVERTDKTAGDS